MYASKEKSFDIGEGKCSDINFIPTYSGSKLPNSDSHIKQLEGGNCLSSPRGFEHKTKNKEKLTKILTITVIM